MWNGWGMGHGLGGGLWMVLLWLVPIALVIWAIQATGRRGAPPSGPTKTALDILDEEYARGRLSREEYLQKREDLRRG